MNRIKNFLEEHTHLKIAIQYLGIFNGGFHVQVYNTTWKAYEPVFESFFISEDLSLLNVDFETAIMLAIEDWYKEQEKAFKHI